LKKEKPSDFEWLFVAVSIGIPANF